MNKLEKALSGLLNRSELISGLAQVLSHTVKKAEYPMTK